MNAVSWEPWTKAAASKGYVSAASSWPYHDGEPGDLRANVPAGLGALTFGDVVEHFTRIIDALSERPVLIGHSVGGLVVQKLVNDGYARAGVAISPAPPQGVTSFEPVFLRANFPHVNPFAGNTPVLMTPERFHFTFCNTMSRAASDEAFERYVVPESRNVPRGTLTRQARVDFGKDHVPMLLIAGDTDHLTPAAMVKANARRYSMPVDFRQFSNRSHFICNQDGWEEVADTVFDWIAAH
jgi:pimeloyl-ACP methyl ester carboxylesterase